MAGLNFFFFTLKGGEIPKEKETIYCHNSARVLYVYGCWPCLPKFYAALTRKGQRNCIGTTKR